MTFETSLGKGIGFQEAEEEGGRGEMVTSVFSPEKWRASILRGDKRCFIYAQTIGIIERLLPWPLLESRRWKD